MMLDINYPNDANMILAWYNNNTPITTLFKDAIVANQNALPGD